MAVRQLQQQSVHEDAYQRFNKSYGGAPDDVTVTSENAAIQQVSIEWQNASILENSYATGDIEMSKEETLTCAKEIISLTKEQSRGNHCVSTTHHAPK